MLRGEVSPVFFGSAVTNFGVQLFLDRFVAMAPAPGPRPTADGGEVEPTDERFTGFVFKVQANMDPRHRDRVAFVRVCSGKFERDMVVKNARTGKEVRLSRAMRLFADERESLGRRLRGRRRRIGQPGRLRHRRYGLRSLTGRLPGDPRIRAGTFRIGPEYRLSGLQIVRQRHRAAARRGGDASFLSVRIDANRTDPRGVGELQFEVAKYRLEAEYSVKTVFSTLAFSTARHVEGDAATIAAAKLPSNAKLVEDWEGRPVALFESEWSLRLAQEWNPQLTFGLFSADTAKEVVST